MSKNAKSPERPLHERIANARREGRTQHALELTRQYFKFEQTEERRELLRQVTLERGQQLLAQGKPSDAATVFSNALEIGGSAGFHAAVIRGLAGCGAIERATASLPKIADPNLRQGAMNAIVDAAVAQGPTGRNALPESLQAPFDSMMRAFHAYVAGNDDDARAALQNIGLQSPFLEWKVLLRGLIAYQANDDVRALENWQRLDPTRLPARLCAACRAGIDQEYLKAQPAHVQQALRAKLLQQQGASFAPALRELRDLLHKENLAPAFRKAELIVPIMRRECPQLAARLAQVFFWTIVEQGQPEDVDRYLRVFGSPPDDPKLHRLEALAVEARGLWPEAHGCWQKFINQAAQSPEQWPGEVGQRVQAMIWSRMAENAMPDRKRKGQSGNPLFDLFADNTGPLKPSAEQCLEKAIKLAPDRLESYRDLFDVYCRDRKYAKAKKIGQELLKRFPNDAATLEALALMCVENQEYQKALEFLQKAVQANPLDRSIHTILAIVRQRWGLRMTLDGKFDNAREQYDHALKIWTGPKTPLLCQWAVCELKAKNSTRADELIAQALADPGQRLACRYTLVGESIRAKLPPKEKKRIAADLKAALSEAPTPAEIVVLIQSAGQQHVVHDETFHGQKTQEKSIVKFLEQMHFEVFDEMQLSILVGGLQVLQARKAWLNCLNFARRRYLKNVLFRLSFVDYYLLDVSTDPKTHLAREHLDAARRLIQEMPRGEEQQRLLDEIQDKEEFLTQLESRNRGMMDVLDQIFGNKPMPFNDAADDYDDDEFY